MKYLLPYFPALLAYFLILLCPLQSLVAQPDITGFWDQYIFDHIEGKWTSFGTFRV